MLKNTSLFLETPSVGNLVIWGGALIVWCALYGFGLWNYAGSFHVYTLFSLVFLMLLISGFVWQISYGYLFLTAMLWLGFWLKLTVHLWIDYLFSESIGNFDHTPSSWDEVLTVASLGSLGVLASRVCFFTTKLVDATIVVSETIPWPILQWFNTWRTQLWLGLILLSLAVVSVNVTFGILQIGLVPRTILPWPINAFISYAVGRGLALMVAVFLWWDILLRKDMRLSLYSVVLEACISSVSVLSRGMYVFHVVPQFLAVFKNRWKLARYSLRNFLLLSIVTAVLFIISVAMSNTLREHFYSDTLTKMPSYSDTLTKMPSYSDALTKMPSYSDVLTKMLSLVVDRWIGLEGLMVMQAYSAKGEELFLRGLLERREIGKDTIYSEISRPVYYGFVNKEKFQFSELPGAMAFFFFSNRYWAVILGMFFLSVCVLGSELILMRLAGNPLLAALYGMFAANTVAQFGVSPIMSLFPLAVTAFAIMIVAVLQSRSAAVLFIKVLHQQHK